MAYLWRLLLQVIEGNFLKVNPAELQLRVKVCCPQLMLLALLVCQG